MWQHYFSCNDYCNFYGTSCTLEEQIKSAKSTAKFRLVVANVYNFFLVSFGWFYTPPLVDMLVSPAYVPQSDALQSYFLNFNEKQYTTQASFLYYSYLDPVFPANIISAPNVGYSVYNVSSGYVLPSNVPIYIFMINQTLTNSLQNQCLAQNLQLNSQECQYIYASYYQRLALNNQIVQRYASAGSKLIMCGTNCTAANGIDYYVDQFSMIPWFAQNLWSKIGGITL